jgi:hypothetical protein
MIREIFELDRNTFEQLVVKLQASRSFAIKLLIKFGRVLIAPRQYFYNCRFTAMGR